MFPHPDTTFQKVEVRFRLFSTGYCHHYQELVSIDNDVKQIY